MLAKDHGCSQKTMADPKGPWVTIALIGLVTKAQIVIGTWGSDKQNSYCHRCLANTDELRTLKRLKRLRNRNSYKMTGNFHNIPLWQTRGFIFVIKLLGIIANTVPFYDKFFPMTAC